MKLRCLLPLLVAAGCANQASITDRPCPCAEGWVCDTTTNTCVHDLPPGADAGPPPPDAGSSPPDGRPDASPSDPAVELTSRPSVLTNDSTAVFTFTVSDSRATVTCNLDGGNVGLCSSPYRTPPLPDGTHHLVVRAVSSGNHVGTAEASWTVDATNPALAIDGGPDGLIASSSATFTFTSGDATATLACKLDGGDFAPCSSPVDLTALADGEHTFTVRATDPAGNATEEHRNWIIDTGAPAVTIDGGPEGLVTSTSASFTFATSDATAALLCAFDNGGFAHCGSPVVLNGVADGPHTFTVRAIDPANNAAEDHRSWTVDATRPVVTFAPVADSIATHTPTLSFTTADQGSSVAATECSIDSGGFAPCTSPYTTAFLPDGNHQLTVRARDVAGNLGSATATFTIDTVAPAVSIAAVASPTGVSPSIAFTASDDRPFVITECQVDSDAFARCTSPFVTAPVGNGSHNVSVRATDRAGNTAVDSTSFVVSAPPYRHTIRIDGANDFFGAGLRGEVIGTTTRNSVLAYVSWDASNLYLGWETFAIGSEPDPGLGFTMYVDVDPGASAGAASAQTFGTQAATLPAGFLADYLLRWTTDGAITLAQFDGTAWLPVATTGVVTAAGSAFLELAVPLARLGNPSHFGLLGAWQSTGNGIERTFAGWFTDSFTDGDYRAANPAPIQHWLDVDLASPTPPNAPVNKR